MKNKHGSLYLAVLHTWSTINRIYSHRKYIPPFESTLSGKLIEHDKVLAEYRHSLVVSSSKGLITVQNSCNLFQQHKHSRVRETLCQFEKWHQYCDLLLKTCTSTRLNRRNLFINEYIKRTVRFNGCVRAFYILKQPVFLVGTVYF